MTKAPTEFTVEAHAQIAVSLQQTVVAKDGHDAMTQVCDLLRESLPEVAGHDWIINEVHVERI